MTVNTELPTDSGYTARLHLVNFIGNHSSYRTLEVEGLEEPHIEAVEARSIDDPTTGKSYDSALLHPQLVAIDFPPTLNPHTDLQEWLSRNKRALFDRAVSLDEMTEAAMILGTGLDAQMHSTHFVNGRPRNRIFTIVSANKLTRQDNPVEPSRYLGRRLVAFTTGEGRKNRTAAVSAVIARVAEKGLLPAPPLQPRSHANLAEVACLQMLYLQFIGTKHEQDMSLHRNYLLTSYDNNGAYIPLADGEKDPPKAIAISTAEARRRELFPDAAGLWRSDEPPRPEAELAFEQLEAAAQLIQPLKFTPNNAEQLASYTDALLRQY